MIFFVGFVHLGEVWVLFGKWKGLKGCLEGALRKFRCDEEGRGEEKNEEVVEFFGIWASWVSMGVLWGVRGFLRILMVGF